MDQTAIAAALRFLDEQFAVVATPVATDPRLCVTDAVSFKPGLVREANRQHGAVPIEDKHAVTLRTRLRISLHRM